MAWTLNGTRVFVTDMTGDDKNITARLQPLADGTIFHHFGYESEVVKVIGLVVGKSDLDELVALRQTGTSYGLHLDSVPYLSGIVNAVSWQWSPYKYQTLRPDLDCETPVFAVTVEMFLGD